MKPSNKTVKALLIKGLNPFIVKRSEPEPHYELHFSDHVEFWTFDNKKIGESNIEKYKRDDSHSKPLRSRDKNG